MAAILSLKLAAMVQARSDLSPHETLVGLMMALAADKRTGVVWLKRETMQSRTRLSLGQLTRALSGLVHKGVVERSRTPRATLYFFPQEKPVGRNKKTGEMDGPPVNHRIAHQWTTDEAKPPRERVPGYTDEQWEACRVMMRDKGLEMLRAEREEPGV